MAEAARRCPSEVQAPGTPRKRIRGSPTPHSSPSAFETPVKKRIRAFPEGPSPSQKSGKKRWFASQVQWSPSSGEEMKENRDVPVKAATSRRLDVSPLRVSRLPQGGSPGKPSLKSSSSKPHVPLGSFYGRGKNYLDPVERKKLQEIRELGARSGNGNVPESSSGNGSGNPDPRAAKHPPKPKRGQGIPKSKKGKAQIPAGKPSAEKEAGNCLVRKKMDSPFRVLSMKVKPALKLQLGAAFFAARKKSHSKKNPGDPKALPKPPQEDAEPAEGSGAPEGRGEPGRIPVAQEEGKESSGNGGESGHGGEEASPQKSGSVSRDSEAGAAGGTSLEKGGSDGISSSQGWESEDCVIPSSQSPPPKGHKQASPSKAVVYPIFSAALASRKRPLDEIPPGKVPHSSQKSRRAKELCRRSRDQMIIDAGQKHFGAVVCKSCGMIYSAASPEDEAQHVQHHQRFLEALRYLGWKKERVVAEFWDGRIVLILPTDPKYAVKKAEEVRELVDEELGFQPASVPVSMSASVSPRRPARSGTRTYLFVSGGSIVGSLLAEPIAQAFRVLSEPGPAPCPGQHSRAWRCSAQPEPALCGISRIWVLGMRRRSGIARRMVDVLRSTFMYGSVLSSREIAFSDPTPLGKLFATSYCQTPNFLVYNFLSK